MAYDCIIVGGGIAGLQAAIQLGRYKHNILVIDSSQGRSNLCKCFHNVLGWPDGVSGTTLRQLGRTQAERLGVSFVSDEAHLAERVTNGFRIRGHNGEYEGKRLLLATGIVDRIPILSEVLPCLGITVYVCPDCDGYEITGRRTVVLGAGDPGARMALTLTDWTDNLAYINHEQTPVEENLLQALEAKGIEYWPEPIREVLVEGDHFRGVVLRNGSTIQGNRAFVAFGGNLVKSSLAKQLGVDLLDNQHIPVDPRTKMTNIPNVWAAGDVAAHSEQVTIAMGDGSQAAIWIHKSLAHEPGLMPASHPDRNK